MKKNNKINKIIILSIIGLIFVISAVIFILNYTKDGSSFSLFEKQWINNHTSKVIDVSVYNDVPIYGQDGEGVIFAYLDEFTKSYDIQFNKVSYLTSNDSNLRDVAFRVLDYNEELTDNDILMYKDYYVIVSLDDKTISSFSDLSLSTMGVFDSDIGHVRYYLNDALNVKYTTVKDIDEMISNLKSKDIKYAIIPGNRYLSYILENDLYIVGHVDDIYKKYVLTVNGDNTFRSIMKKYNLKYNEGHKDDNNKDYFLETFFKTKKISEYERTNYNSQSYTFGLVNIMPFSGLENKELVGILTNYLNQFEELANVDFKIVLYDNISLLKQALSHGEIDLLFGNFNVSGVNTDYLSTGGLFKEEYFVLSIDNKVVNSIRSLKDTDVYTVKDTYLYDYLVGNGLKVTGFQNTDELLRNIHNEDIVVVDKETYEYYKNNKFKNHKIIHNGSIDNQYTFIVRDVNKNKTFYELFKYYVMSFNYKEIRYDYNTDYMVNAKNEVTSNIKYIGIVVVVLAIVLLVMYMIYKFKNRKKELNKEDKLKFIDVMTSLKNRNYLNYNIKLWEENKIYPQSIIIIDLNNVKYINDNYGHVEGDEVIKKAANILINNQQDRTDIIRTDGNEFLIYMMGYDEKNVIDYTRKLSKEFKELPHGFGAAIGYSMITDDIKTIDDAINEATLSMRQAKENL